MTPLAYAIENGADEAAMFLLGKSGFVYSVLSAALRKGHYRVARCGLTSFLYQRMRDYCIGVISSRWRAEGANADGAGGL
jgi:thiosulfate reductase cytochrome b subunit